MCNNPLNGRHVAYIDHHTDSKTQKVKKRRRTELNKNEYFLSLVKSLALCICVVELFFSSISLRFLIFFSWLQVLIDWQAMKVGKTWCLGFILFVSSNVLDYYAVAVGSSVFWFNCLCSVKVKLQLGCENLGINLCICSSFTSMCSVWVWYHILFFFLQMSFLTMLLLVGMCSGIIVCGSVKMRL